MIYLTGVHRDETVGVRNLGLLVTPDTGYRRQIPRYDLWAADNACYAQGDRFDLDRFLFWLEGLQRYHCPRPGQQECCLFAVAPDVVGNAAATIERSRPVLPQIRDLGFPAALVAQDGLENLVTDWGEWEMWDEFDVLFIGGSTEWKLGTDAAWIAAEASAHGKWVHMGRVNSYKRLRYATEIGCDSVDGTYLRRAPDQNLPKLKDWLVRVNSISQSLIA